FSSRRRHTRLQGDWSSDVCSSDLFQRRDVSLERFAGRVLRAGVLVAFVLPETLLDVGRGLIDRRHDGAGEGVGDVSGVHGARRQTPDQVLSRYLGHGGNVRAPSAASKRPLRYAPMPQPNAVKCLVVDDEPRLRRVLVRLLEGEGFTCSEAGSGKPLALEQTHEDAT